MHVHTNAFYKEKWDKGPQLAFHETGDDAKRIENLMEVEP
jgi:hypothetical protein